MQVMPPWYTGLTLVYVASALPKVCSTSFHSVPRLPDRRWRRNCGCDGVGLTLTVQVDLSAASVAIRDGVQVETSSALTSAVIIGDDDLRLQTVTSTELPSIQTPTVTSASEGPQTVGFIITALETDGYPSLPPFPTSLPSISASTLLPTDPLAPFDTSTATHTTSSHEQTITVPQSTVELVAVSSVVTEVSLEVTTTFTTAAVINTTDSEGNPTSYVGTTVVTSTGTVVSETTISAASTETSTIAQTITTAGSLSSLAVETTTTCVFSIGCDGQDMFLPIDVTEPPTNIEQQDGHPVERLGILNQTGPIETNKFYSNFYLGDQSYPAFPVPYSLTWAKGSGNAESWGIAISHIDSSQRVYGPSDTEIPNDPASYYINPLGIQSLILSAAELQDETNLTTDSLEVLSGNVHLSPTAGASPILTIPMASGMAFVTGLYTNCQPLIESSVFFSSVGAVNITSSGVSKYTATLDDGNVWLIYAISDNGIAPNFELVSSTTLQGISSWSGTIQIAKLPSGVDESVYDNAAGTYPTSGSISGYASGDCAQYSLSWNKGGPYASNTTLLMFALPHHVQSFDNTTQASITNLSLNTLTKGVAWAVSADYWVLEEQLPTDMGFMPWRPDGEASVQRSISATELAVAQGIAAVEASQNMSAQTNLNSMYYSGKALSKFATLVFAMNNITQQESLAVAALTLLEEAFDVFSNNQQEYPLLYDLDWKGVVSSASYLTGNSGDDFGNSYYNDHHFHYGYFLQAAAIIGHLDPSWLADNKDYVNALARDTSNPSSLDQYFPVFRSFDFYHGHSWAKGLFESGDGKDEESSSEDAMHAYGLKMWGQTVGDASMEARGNLMLAILARSLQSYFLLESSNTNQPAEFIGNKVTGILFENKVDHTTYFGTNFEYIQGIHMIPLMPFSTLTRTTSFVAEEWATYFADNASDPAWNVTGGWKGILYSNLGIVNATAALDFFTQADFDSSWLDGGASRTWYICLSALLG